MADDQIPVKDSSNNAFRNAGMRTLIAHLNSMYTHKKYVQQLLHLDIWLLFIDCCYQKRYQ